MTRITEIRNGRVVTPSTVVEDGHVVVSGGHVVRVGETPDYVLPDARTIDADGRVVMPGLVDLHGDDIEHHRHPRSGADVDPRTALTAADRTNLLNGVTTKFHAVAFENAPDDDRSLDDAETVAAELASEQYTLADNRLHARCELSDVSKRAVESLIEAGSVDLLSIMHHAPGDGQYDRATFERHYTQDRGFSDEAVAELAVARQSVDATAQRERIEQVADLAARADVPLASHDDESASKVESMAAHGATITEYPLTLDTAERAAELGVTTAMGAPNLVRGGSLCDNLDARKAVDRGVVDMLCADYHPPSLLAAPFVDTGEDLPTRVNRVTRNPADAAGLDDRGRIEVGARADVIVVDPEPTPTVETVLVQGEEVVRASRESATATQPAPTAGS